MKGWRLTSTVGGDTLHIPPTRARSDCPKAFSCCLLASSPSPCDSRRRQPTVAAAAHVRLAQSYAVCSRLLPSRHAPTHSCDANMRLSPVATRWRRQAVTCRQTHPLKSHPRGMFVCHEKRHRDREREHLRSARRNKCYTHGACFGGGSLHSRIWVVTVGGGGECCALRAPHIPRAAVSCALATALAALTTAAA